jgi:hypothetical protein
MRRFVAKLGPERVTGVRVAVSAMSITESFARATSRHARA